MTRPAAAGPTIRAPLSAAGNGEQQYRAPVQQGDESQQQRRVRERQDQPGLSHRVHPGRDLGGRLGDEEDPEVSIAQRAEGLWRAHPGATRTAAPLAATE